MGGLILPMSGGLSPLGWSRSAAGVHSRWDNLLAGWHLDEFSDELSGGVTRADVLGVVTLADNNTTPSVAGLISNAAKFTAANSEFLSVADPFSFTAAATWSWWQRQQNVTGDQAKLTKWQHGTSTDWAIQVTGTAGTVRIYLAPSANDGGTAPFRMTNPITLDVWQHIVIVYDGSGATDADRLKMYLDGVAETVVVEGAGVPAALQNGTSEFRWGAFSGTLTRYDDGDTDEAYVFSDAKDQAWVDGMYNGGAGVGHPN